jgi:hypothetical protein
MERRLVLKQLLILTGGAVLLPSCLSEPNKASVKLKNIRITKEEEDLITNVVDIIIPKTNTPGAKGLGVHLFVLKMLDDCYDDKAQNKFMLGMDQFKTLIHDKYNTTFNKCTKAEQQQVINLINSNSTSTEPITQFYKMIKQNTIKGYVNSEYVMTKLVIYELVPGRYNGYFPVKTLKKRIS